jgi:hypothetical protein
MKLVALVVSCAALAACEKAGPQRQQLAPEEMKLLHDLPGGNLALVGGNLLRMQSFMSTLIVQLAADTGGQMVADADANRTFAECFSGKGNIRGAAGVTISPRLDLRMVIAGKTIQDLATCAEQAHYPIAEDPDHKFIVLTVTALGKPVWSAGYLQLPDGNLLTDMAFDGGTFAPLPRADLEKLVATLPKASAADDKHPIELAAKTDRTKTFWFAGSDEHGDIYGAFDLAASALSVDVTIDFSSTALATEFDNRCKKLRELSATAPAPMKTLVDNTHVDRSNARVHVTSSATIDMIEQVVKVLAVRRH